MGGGGLQNGRGGGTSEVFAHTKRVAEKVVAILNGGGGQKQTGVAK